MKVPSITFPHRCSAMIRKTMITFLFVHLNLKLLHVTCWAFSPTTNIQRNTRRHNVSCHYLKVSFPGLTHLHGPKVCHDHPRLNNSKEDEIAALEQRLRKLKEEAAVDQHGDDDRNPIPEREESQSLPSTQQEPLEEMLSESWKDNEPSDQGGLIRNFLAAALLVVASVFFAQVPVGQESLDKYSTAKPSTTIDLGDLNPVKNNGNYDF